MMTMQADETKENVASMEDLDQARRIFRSSILYFFLAALGGLCGAFYFMIHPVKGMRGIGGLDVAEWLLVLTLGLLVIIAWGAAYRVSVKIKNMMPFYLTLVMMPLFPILSTFVDKEARKHGQKMGPFWSSFRPVKK